MTHSNNQTLSKLDLAFIITAFIAFIVAIFALLNADWPSKSKTEYVQKYNISVASEHLQKNTIDDIHAITDAVTFYSADEYATLWKFADRYGIEQFHLRELTHAERKAFPGKLTQIDDYIRQNSIDPADAALAVKHLLSQETGDITAQLQYMLNKNAN